MVRSRLSPNNDYHSAPNGQFHGRLERFPLNHPFSLSGIHASRSFPNEEFDINVIGMESLMHQTATNHNHISPNGQYNDRARGGGISFLTPPSTIPYYCPTNTPGVIPTDPIDNGRYNAPGLDPYGSFAYTPTRPLDGRPYRFPTSDQLTHLDPTINYQSSTRPLLKERLNLDNHGDTTTTIENGMQIHTFGNNNKRNKTVSKRIENGDNKEENREKRPQVSYPVLIALALMNSITYSLPLPQIYSSICKLYPYYRTAADGWKNSIRHSLTTSKCFERVEERSPHDTRVAIWKIRDEEINTVKSMLEKHRNKNAELVCTEDDEILNEASMFADQIRPSTDIQYSRQEVDTRPLSPEPLAFLPIVFSPSPKRHKLNNEDAYSVNPDDAKSPPSLSVPPTHDTYNIFDCFPKFPSSFFSNPLEYNQSPRSIFSSTSQTENVESIEEVRDVNRAGMHNEDGMGTVEVIELEEYEEIEEELREHPLDAQLFKNENRLQERENRPKVSYPVLIALALKSSPNCGLRVTDIYKYIREKFPYYQTASENWKNSIRHSLSMKNKWFKKVDSSNQDVRLGIWRINDEDKRISDKIEKKIRNFRQKNAWFVWTEGDKTNFDTLPTYPAPVIQRSHQETRAYPVFNPYFATLNQTFLPFPTYPFPKRLKLHDEDELTPNHNECKLSSSYTSGIFNREDFPATPLHYEEPSDSEFAYNTSPVKIVEIESTDEDMGLGMDVESAKSADDVEKENYTKGEEEEQPNSLDVQLVARNTQKNAEENENRPLVPCRALALALKNSPVYELPVSEIYSIVCEMFPNNRDAAEDWKNSIRYILSNLECFEKKEDTKWLVNARQPAIWKINTRIMDTVNYIIRKFKKKNPSLIPIEMTKIVDDQFSLKHDSANSPNIVELEEERTPFVSLDDYQPSPSHMRSPSPAIEDRSSDDESDDDEEIYIDEQPIPSCSYFHSTFTKITYEDMDELDDINVCMSDCEENYEEDVYIGLVIDIEKEEEEGLAEGEEGEEEKGGEGEGSEHYIIISATMNDYLPSPGLSFSFSPVS